MADTEVISWISPDNVETIITVQDWIDVSGWSGFNNPDFEHIEDPIPFEDGSFYRRSKTLPRELEIDLIVWGANRSELFQRIRQLTQSLNVYKGIGKIKFVSPDLIERSIFCLYKQGLEGNEGEDGGVSWRKITLTFRAFDPYFYGSETTEVFQLDQNPPMWFPFFPLNLGGDAVVSQIQIDNTGDVKTFPVWTIHGPGDDPKMTNLTTGEVLTISGVTLDENQTITIDTKSRQITLDDNINLLPLLAWGSTFWTLEPGVNQVKIEMANATASSSIQLAYSPRYLGV
jgi:phage-related protein